MLHLSRLILLSGVAIASLLVGVATARQTASSEAPLQYAIACRLEVADHDVTDMLARQVQHRATQIFRAILGPDVQVRHLSDEQGSDLPSLPTADKQTMIERWSGPERLMMLRIGRQEGEFVVQAREYDSLFQVVGPICETRTMHREMVADGAGREILEAFSPLALIRSATGSNVQIEFVGGRRVFEYRHWLGLSEGVGLQLLREPVAGATGVRPMRFRTSFLALRSWEGTKAECEIVGPDRVLADFGTAAVRYLARPFRGGTSATGTVQVVRRDGRQPQPDCEVFVSAQQYSTAPDSLRGLTDRSGTLQFSSASSSLQYVCVRYEDLVIKSPYLPGASPDPITFELPTRGRRAEFIRPLKQLIQEIDDQYLVDLRLREDLKARAEAKDVAEVRKLIERGRSTRITFEDVSSQVREIQRRAEAEGEDVREAAAQVRQNAEKKISRQLEETLALYGDWAQQLDKRVAIDALTTQINQLQARMDWEALVPVFEKLVEQDPTNVKVAEELKLLKKDLKIRSPDHGQARSFVNEQLPVITTGDLSSRWSEIDRSAHELLNAKDHLTLLKLRRSMNTWARELGTEVKGLLEQLQAAEQDEERTQELRERLDHLKGQHDQLLKLHQEVQQFLGSLKL